MTDFCREIEVIFGPLKDWEKNEGKSPLVRILSDGTPNTLRVRAAVSKPCLACQTQALFPFGTSAEKQETPFVRANSA